MRTNVVIDDELINEAIRLSGIKTKKEVISFALRELVRKENGKTFWILPVRSGFEMIMITSPQES